MKKNTTPIEGATLATLHTEIDRYCRRFGYDHATAFEQLLNLMVNWLEIEDNCRHKRHAPIPYGYRKTTTAQNSRPRNHSITTNHAIMSD